MAMARRRSVLLWAGAIMCATGSAATAKLSAQPLAGESSDAGAGTAIQSGIEAWERGDDAAAVEMWAPWAQAGDPDAMFNLAQAYRLGRGVPADAERAEALYRQAAALGHVAAAAAYAIVLYARGEEAQAMPLLLEAAEGGDARARYLVGLAHFNGDLLPQDWPRAFALLTLAANANLAPARSALARVEDYLDTQQKAEGIALLTYLDSTAGVQGPVSARAVATLEPERVRADGEASSSAVDLRKKEPPAQAFANAHGVASQPSSQAPAFAPAPAMPQVVMPALAASASVSSKAPSQGARSPVRAPLAGPFRIQLGAFGVSENAARLRQRLADEPVLAGYQIIAEPVGRLTFVTALGFSSLAAAQASCAELRAKGFECLARR